MNKPKKLFAIILCIAMLICMLPVGALTASATDTPNGLTYVEGGGLAYYKDGFRVREEMITVNGNSYYFDYWGLAETGIFSIYDDNNKKSVYYLADENGIIQNRPNEWRFYDNKWYYVKSNGMLAQDEVFDIGNATYLFQYNGIMKTGLSHFANNIYYCNNSGEVLKSQWIKDGNNWYYAKTDGVLARDEWVGNYYFKDYIMVVGWEYTGKEWGWCQFDSNGNYIGRVNTKVGWQKIGDQWYYYAVPDESYTGWIESGNDWYYIQNNRMLYDEFFFPDFPNGSADNFEDGYYLDYTGKMLTGWTKINNDWHYADSNGILACWEWKNINGKWYYFDQNTRMVDSVYPTDRIDGKLYYSDFTASGEWIGYVNKQGWYLAVNGDWYYNLGFEDIDGAKKIINKTYYFEENKMLTNTLYFSNETYTHFWIDANGTKDEGAGWRTQTDYNGEDYDVSWIYIENGVVAKGFKNIGGTWYYFNNECVMVTGWLNDDGTWYYMNSSGAMVTGWQQIGGTWYYFYSGGNMATGWILDGGVWYLLDSSGAWIG